MPDAREGTVSVPSATITRDLPLLGRLSRTVLLELSGALIALALATIAVAHVLSSTRVWLLFTDGDSVMLALVHASLAAGQSQDWATSPVLFIPELGVYLALSAFGLGTRATLLISAVLNFTGLYLTLRFVIEMASERMPRADRLARILGCLLALAVVVVFVFLDSSADRNSLELVSLLATTTYYSATILAVIVTIGLLARLSSPDSGQRSTVIVLVTTILVVTLSMLSNPLFAAWALVPLGGMVVGLVALRTIGPLDGLRMLAPLVAGALLGLILRIPFTHLIALDGSSYLRPGNGKNSLDYYGGLVAQRLATPDGTASLLLVCLLVAANAALSLRARSLGWTPGTIICAAGWVIPVVVAVGAIALGTNASRYLQPVFFAPILGIALLPGLRYRAATSGSRRRPSPATVIAISIVAAMLVSVGLFRSAPLIVASAEAPDRSISCVDDWVTASHRVGVGQFWSIRAPKASLRDPAQLIQVDDHLNGYAWLVNRADFRGVRSASFIISSADSRPLVLPQAVSALPTTTIACGRYTITDYEQSVLPIGTVHS